MELMQIRNIIDRLDLTILKALNERLEMGLLARRCKHGIEDKKREQEVLERIKQYPAVLMDTRFLEKLFIDIMGQSKALQAEDFQLMAFQGEHGAYGEVASQQWNRDLIPIPCTRFDAVFEGVQSGIYDYGIVPVENSLGGNVEQVNRLMINTPLHVIGAVKIPVHLCLLALPGTDHREIRTVYSHPQALSQCRRFMERNNLEPVPDKDTAGAARMLSEKGLRGSAAIASRLAARLYGLEVIKENVEDLSSNMTRFLVLSKEENKQEGNKCSIVFSTQHKAGTLFRVLERFARNDINLTRIESIPYAPGSYAFFLDFEGSLKRPAVMETVKAAEDVSTRFRVLGCYQEKNK
ncbi:MAG: bifunctional chorismate mutase/prephenate dehydratase [Desulfobacteraceae bacterium]